ncbi:protein inturned isoform X2 [Alosa sapidissima]|uniref:protein inturned isoform X2 n=1 Tax=Alosa sapidissima TaxID=34773 RepID=UPI001C0941BF|nr:protein inturned isoform X2 [Alosa sapidissima]
MYGSRVMECERLVEPDNISSSGAPFRREAAEDVGDAGSDSNSTASSDYSDELEPEWLDEVQRNGELFYLELSEGEEEEARARASAANHVRFSEQEAEIITEEGRHRGCGGGGGGSDGRVGSKVTPRLKRLAGLLRRKKHGRGARGEGSPSRPPPSILKNQAVGARHTGQQQQQQPILKDVCVYLNPKRLAGTPHLLPESGGLLEALLGVVHRGGRGTGPQRLTVHGLVPNSPASRSGHILIGDVILAVDDVEVTSENIERILSCIPGPTQVRLTLETTAPDGGGCPFVEDEGVRGRGSAAVSQLVRLLWGEDTVELQMAISHIPHVIMYLSLRLDTEPTHEEEVLYQYPVSEASTQLKGVRGIFLTLCDMLENVTGGQIISSSLLLKRQLVHVGYWKEGDNLLVIGLPADRVPLIYLQSVVEGVVRTLRVMYGSLDSAFCEEDNSPRLDHFFCLFFQQLIQPSRLIDSPTTPDVSGTLFLDGLPAVRWLTLPPEIKVEVDTVLSDFEAADFGDMSEDFYGMRRLYVTLGSCLFYKGYLIANHLPKEDLRDVCLYCQHYSLLPLAAEQRVGQLVIWREVFPQRRALHSPPLGYAEPLGRYFLLIVGLRHLMQCVLLEAGGCASAVEGAVGPDCVYVDQVKATLLQLEGLEAGMEERLNAPPAPCLSCADWFLPSGAGLAGGQGQGQTARDRLPSISRLANALRPLPPRARRPSPQRSLSDSGSEGGHVDVGGAAMPPSPGSTPDSARKTPPATSASAFVRRDSLGSGGSDGSGGSGSLFRTPKLKHPNPFYLGSLRKSLTERETEEMNSTLKLTSGLENTLFHYVLMESVQGVFIAPTHRDMAQLSGTIHPQLIRNFHHCCLSIRAAFQQSLPPRERRDMSRQHGGLGPVKEHGVLFQCKPENWTDQKKPAPTMTYWVIGRMLLEPIPQEFYVCFHDSVPEVPVEMAFRLSFGLAL